MKFNCGKVWGQLPPSIPSFSPLRSWICHRPCLRSDTHLGCWPLPRTALCMHQSLQIIVPLLWILLVTLRVYFFIAHVFCARPRICAPLLYHHASPLETLAFIARSSFVLLSCLQLLGDQMPLLCVTVVIHLLLLHVLCAFNFSGLTSLTAVLVRCVCAPLSGIQSDVSSRAHDSCSWPFVGCISAWWFH